LNAEAIYDWFKSKPGVKHVYYPKGAECSCKCERTCTRIYAQFMKCTADAGYGGLLSVTLEDGYCPKVTDTHSTNTDPNSNSNLDPKFQPQPQPQL